MILSDVLCLSVAYIGLKSRTERPKKTKIGTKVAHVTRDSWSKSRSRARRGHIVAASRLQLVCIVYGCANGLSYYLFGE